MLFSSLTFIFLFLPVVLAVYYLAPLKIRNLLLLLASLIFYAWGEPVYVVLMILSILLNYCCGREIAANAEDERKAHRGMIFAVAVNLALLFFFKYYGFFLELVNSVTSVELTYRELALPVGISFYTFQGISYVVDVYRGKAKAQRSLLNFALYIALFPQLIAGPIVRYEDIEPQLAQRKVSARKLGQGAMLFLIGLAKKAVLADTFKTVFEEISAISASNLSVPMAWIGCITYAFEIYYDFSGYSDMAIGLSRMFGFELKKNFDHPYVSRSVTEFWRRWHISLSSWFKDYLYIPLGGNRKGKVRKYINIMIVFLVSGLWHGANWSYVIWGGLNGIYQVIGAVFTPFRNKIREKLHLKKNFFPLMIIYIVVTFVLVDFTWIFFRADTVQHAFAVIQSIFNMNNPALLANGALYDMGLSRPNFIVLGVSLLILLTADICKYRGIKIRSMILNSNIVVRWIVVITGILGILVFGIWGSGYSATNFIYFQF